MAPSEHQNGMNGGEAAGAGEALNATEAVCEVVLGKELYAAVSRAKLLVVGAGGIGCELLKDLILTGFQDIEVIDLDTIDVSNLNRQFLFRARHVGQPKAVVAREVVLELNPKTKIIAHHDNVKAARFGLDYFKKFTMVLNALDNIDARRHVNRMCLATGKPMIDAGTTGYVGQVNVIKKGEAACYECEEKPTQKVYPICTIRSTPDRPVHCIVWAKEAYRLLFGQADASMLYEAPDAPEPSLYMPVVNERPDPTAGPSAALLYGAKVLKALFHDELAARVAKGLYKKAQSEPQPTACLASTKSAEEIVEAYGPKEGGGEKEKVGKGKEAWSRSVWNEEECVGELLSCFAQVYGDEAQAKHLGSFAFDKDDALAMRFVTAATNLRAASFGIPSQSFYDVKGIAGNIVPAIATTNAMAAGLQVLEALKILKAPANHTIVQAGCKVTYIVRGMVGRKRLLLQPTELHGPSAGCFVCNRSGVDLMIDTTRTTLAELVDKVLKGKLGFSQPSVMLGEASIIYEEGEDADEDLAKTNLPKPLAELPAGGIKDQTTIEVDDVSQDLTLQLHVYQRDFDSFDPEEVPEGFLLGGGMKAAVAKAQEQAHAQAQVREDAGKKLAVEDEARGSMKRPREETQGPMNGGGGGGAAEGYGSKKAKVVDLVEEEDGMIILD